ncbi:hypothetical protein AVEN_246285-1 [Araneus ventricosus]|uniref:Uncharacterized protein n=1 Tax=Araneus ventricosus TaxID=182803 RepID=A0A4Y2Q3D9_ARAVE|nr:hypothetical protein AVEN_246285-1 [Araneus ventricosus]
MIYLHLPQMYFSIAKSIHPLAKTEAPFPQTKALSTRGKSPDGKVLGTERHFLQSARTPTLNWKIHPRAAIAINKCHATWHASLSHKMQKLCTLSVLKRLQPLSLPYVARSTRTYQFSTLTPREASVCL